MEKMYKKYKDEAEFFIVYISEAHPSNGWQVGANERSSVVFEEPTKIEERVAIANTCVNKLNLSLPCLIDDMKGTAEKSYAGWPDRYFVIDIDGKVAVHGEKGPRGFKVSKAETGLKAILANENKMTEEQKKK